MRNQAIRVAVAFTAYVALFASCTTTAENSTQRGLTALVGRNITDVIAEKSLYPDSSDLLPNGNTVYRFATGSGATVLQNGIVVSHVCKVWLEANPAGTIVRWRYENCP
jgi:hypothetical protein